MGAWSGKEEEGEEAGRCGEEGSAHTVQGDWREERGTKEGKEESVRKGKW